MKILIVGNSHVGAVMRAHAENPNDDIQFLTYKGNSLLQNLEVNENCELSSSRLHITEAIEDHGLTNVSLNTFDYIFVYGCQLRAAGSGENWFDICISEAMGFSAQALGVARRDFVRNTTHWRFLEEIRKWPLNDHSKVVSIPCPHPNELAPFYKKQTTVDMQSVADVRQFIGDEIRSLGFNYLDTPTSLLADNGYSTNVEFKAPREHDMAHLNTAGGHLVLEAIHAYTQSASKNVGLLKRIGGQL